MKPKDEITIQETRRRPTPCTQCPLRGLPQFRDFSPSELNFMCGFKRGELAIERGTAVLVEGTHSPHLYTVLNGWGFRYKILEDGRRQILNYVLPGDLIGLQGSLEGEMQHSVEALTDTVLCTFERRRLFSLFESHASLAFDIAWIAAQEECLLDEHLLSVGRRSALERCAYLFAYLNQRGRAAGMIEGRRRTIPITQQHVADTLGLSLVHTNKTLRKLADRGWLRWRDRGCEVTNEEELLATAGWEGLGDRKRPFL